VLHLQNLTIQKANILGIHIQEDTLVDTLEGILEGTREDILEGIQEVTQEGILEVTQEDIPAVIPAVIQADILEGIQCVLEDITQVTQGTLTLMEVILIARMLDNNHLRQVALLRTPLDVFKLKKMLTFLNFFNTMFCIQKLSILILYFYI
jgi:hypothetical protein